MGTVETIEWKVKRMTDQQERQVATHRPRARFDLGYESDVCAKCEESWPCHTAVKERCERLYLDEGLGCECGWHDGEGRTDEPVEWTRE
jgi:hypothetical protein